MSRFSKTTTLSIPGNALEATIAFLNTHRDEDYFAYEHDKTWHIGLRSYASLVVDPNGERATRFDRVGKEESHLIIGDLNEIARAFTSEYAASGKIFGQVGFNYSAHISGQAYNPGEWPMLSLMVPCLQASISQDSITVTGYIEDEVSAAFNFIETNIIRINPGPAPVSYMPIDLQANCEDYKSRVGRAISDIKNGKYIKAIPSRIVSLPSKVDMLATLLCGRRGNTPARAFTLKHMGIQATGFSPEVLLSINDKTVFTEALAGTQLANEADLEPTRNKLLNDPKEVMEHCIAIQGSIRRLSHVCSPDGIVVKDFMSIMPRGNVHHLFSHVTGNLSPGKDGWDALPGLMANITVPGLPCQGNMKAIQTFEPHPRELYCGAVLMLDEDPKFFEAALVLRTVFQDHSRQWLQAGAGVTALSNPEREFTETCEKLGSVFPYVVAEAKEL